ncbi:hypothetical protein EDD11_005327 [Mortierella claussenii]|nr:hypothetical protein EDD11_005327 [Mortierella claussenii]
MASGMDKGLMALMGIEDDEPRDEGLAPVQHAQDSDQELAASQETSQGASSFMSDKGSTPLSDPEEDEGDKATRRPSTYKPYSARQASKSRTSASSAFASSTPSSQEGEEEPLFPSNFISAEDSISGKSYDGFRSRSSSSASSPPPPFFPSDSNPFGGASARKVRALKPASSSTSPPSAPPQLFSPGLNPFTRSSPDKIRLKKKTALRADGMTGGGMFSPTLSPRKLKKKTSSAGSSSNSKPSTVITSAFSDSTSPILQTSSSTRRGGSGGGLSSPISSFSLNMKKTNTFSDSDSDISPLEDNSSLSKSSSIPSKIVLDAPSLPAYDLDTEMLTPNKSSFSAGNKGSSVFSHVSDIEENAEENGHGDSDLEELMLQDAQAKNRLKAPSKKELLETQKEMDRLMRTSALPLQPRMSKALDLQSLLKKSQSMLDEKSAARDSPYLKTDESSTATNLHSTVQPKSSMSAKSGSRTISLDDSSDDEDEGDSGSFNIYAQQEKLKAAKAFLISPRRKRVTDDGTSSQMSPLSNTVGKMSLSGDGGGDTGSLAAPPPLFPSINRHLLTSPSKSAKPGAFADVASLNADIRRRQAKASMEMRKKLAIEAQKAGAWMTPEQHAAHIMVLEEAQQKKEKTSKGHNGDDEDADDEEDGDYHPHQGNGIKTGGADDIEEMEIDSADEEAYLSGESEGEGQAGEYVDDEAGEEEDMDEDEDEDEIENEEQDQEQDEEDVQVIKVKRPNKKKVVIEDDGDVNVVVVDRSSLFPAESEDDDLMDAGIGSAEDEGEEVEADSVGSDDEDDEQENGISGSSLASMPLSPFGSGQEDDAIGTLSMSSDILSGKFISQHPVLTLNADPTPAQARNAFDVLSSAAQNAGAGLKRLGKREAKPGRGAISKGEKSAFIEYEAEEEEDEHMGMGGIDYESENDQDDYDLGDGMVDTTVTLNSEDVENVRQLHMQQEQNQHEKEISDLVHGIAAGNLWKRRNGQTDDLDIFDEEDMDGRFQRKKRLKVSEKFEKLADNPTTAAFARALEKNMDDDDIIFLSDPDESNDDDDSGKKTGGDGAEMENDDDDEVMFDKTPAKLRTYVDDEDEIGEGEDDEEALNSDKRKETLHQARMIRYGKTDNTDNAAYEVTVAAGAKAQALPFGSSSTEPSFMTKVKASSRNTDETRVTSSSSQAVDDYSNILQRSKFIRDIVDGVEDPADRVGGWSSSQARMPSLSSASSSAMGVVNRIVDRQSVSHSSAASDGLRSAGGSGVGSGTALVDDTDLRHIAKPRGLTRQNSSFLADDRRTHFLSAVGEEGMSGRAVVDGNRRKVAFAAPSRQASTTTSATTSLSTLSETVVEASSSGTSSVLRATTRKTTMETSSMSRSSIITASGKTGDSNNVVKRVSSWVNTVERVETRIENRVESSQLLDFYSQRQKQGLEDHAEE